MTNKLTSIEELKVEESWKERFKLIQKYFENGSPFKETAEFKSMTAKERGAVNKGILIKIGGFWSFFAAFAFSAFYYLFKGMWLKAIVYTLVLTCFDIVLTHAIPPLAKFSHGYAYAFIFVYFVLFDYYRLKVLKKQW